MFVYITYFKLELSAENLTTRSYMVYNILELAHIFSFKGHKKASAPGRITEFFRKYVYLTFT